MDVDRLWRTVEDESEQTARGGFDDPCLLDQMRQHDALEGLFCLPGSGFSSDIEPEGEEAEPLFRFCRQDGETG